MGSELFSVVYGLSSAASWGAGDFCGGVAAKRTDVYGVIIVSQIIGGILLLALALMLGEAVPEAVHLFTGGMAGLCGAFGLVALYRGLAQGRMGVVAPLAAVVAAVLPVLVGIFNEGFPGIWQILGFIAAFIAVWFLSRGSRHAPFQLSDLKLPFFAGIGFGLFFILIDRVSSVSVLWPLVSARASSATLFSLFALAGKKRIARLRNRFLIIAFAGIFDTGGNAFFALATRIGRLDISTVISSLYPAVTVLLAWLILKEKLDRSQWVGIFSALTALVLIAL